MGNTRSAAGCQFPELRQARPTVRDAARRLLDALEQLTAGTEAPGFHGWENGYGEPAGEALEEARRELKILLASTPHQAQLLTGADFDPAAFNEVWKRDDVQRAGRDYGLRGVAERIWAAAFELARGPCAVTPEER